MLRRRPLASSLVSSLVALLALVAWQAPAHAQEGTDTAAYSANQGLRIGLAPVVLFPTDDGPLGGGLNLEARYGITARPMVIAPGGRLSGYAISGRFVGTAMPTVRVTLPVGPLAPYVIGGVGAGWMGNPSETGVALLAGGGLVLHFGRFFAVGGELTYQTITETELRSLAFGPTISIGG